MAFPSAIEKGGGLYCSQPCCNAARKRPLAERWTAKVDKAMIGCWPWRACFDEHGYGRIGGDDWRHAPPLMAHRVAWELVDGHPIPRGLYVGHICDNRACVRNDEVGFYPCNGKMLPRHGHLFLGTLADNSADMVAKGRSVGGDRHYAHLSPERHVRGGRVPNAVLTEDDVRAIRRRHQAGGITQRALAIEYGITPATLHHVIHRVTWAHV